MTDIYSWLCKDSITHGVKIDINRIPLLEYLPLRERRIKGLNKVKWYPLFTEELKIEPTQIK